jgi:hypothetical protein
MDNKLFEIKIKRTGIGKASLKIGRSDYLAIQLGLLEATENPKILYVFSSNIMSVYRTKEVYDFNNEIGILAPNIIGYTTGEDLGNDSYESSKMEWEELQDIKKWMLIKVISYFGSDIEMERIEKILRESEYFFLEWTKKNEIDIVKKEKTDFAIKIKSLLKALEIK